MNTKIAVTGAGHLLVKRILSPFLYRRQWLRQTERLAAPALAEIQLRLLKRLVRHAYEAVPYYRRIMDERGIAVGDIRTLDDIRCFPILTKKDVLEAGPALVARTRCPWLRSVGRTGGTTGTPLSLPRNFLSVGNEHAFVRRQWDWAGIGLLDRTAYLSGRVVVDPARTQGPFYAYDPFLRELVLSTYHLSEETAGEYVEAIVRHRIRAIVGYPSPIAFLARICRQSGVRVGLHAVLTTSETLTETMRETIASAFDCQVFDFYGSAERVCYIYTCEQGSYHVIPEYGYTEFVPVEGAESGECRAIATGFWNLAMPLIRYDIGDVVIPSDRLCACSRAFPVVKSISGRTGDVVRMSSGRQFGPTLMARVTKGANNILEMQIVQDRLDHIILRYVPNREFTDQDFAHFQAHVAHHMPSELQITYERTDRIDRTQSGKMKFIVSKLQDSGGYAHE